MLRKIVLHRHANFASFGINCTLVYLHVLRSNYIIIYQASITALNFHHKIITVLTNHEKTIKFWPIRSQLQTWTQDTDRKGQLRGWARQLGEKPDLCRWPQTECKERELLYIIWKVVEVRTELKPLWQWRWVSVYTVGSVTVPVCAVLVARQCVHVCFS